jgi:putative FmdB family regulatory protein
MPTYGYRCTACGTEFERFQKMSDPPVTDCECGSQGTVKKRLYPVGIQFKGSGFYVNDYTKAGREATAKSESGENKSEAKADTTTDTKTETKSEGTSSTANTSATESPKSEASKSESKPAPTT